MNGANLTNASGGPYQRYLSSIRQSQLLNTHHALSMHFLTIFTLNSRPSFFLYQKQLSEKPKISSGHLHPFNRSSIVRRIFGLTTVQRTLNRRFGLNSPSSHPSIIILLLNSSLSLLLSPLSRERPWKKIGWLATRDLRENVHSGCSNAGPLSAFGPLLRQLLLLVRTFP